jgi:hypothetical protein
MCIGKNGKKYVWICNDGMDLKKEKRKCMCKGNKINNVNGNWNEEKRKC